MRDSLSRSCLVLASLLLSVLAQQNVVLSSTDPSIIYDPPLCSPSSIIAGCKSPWHVSNTTASGTTVVYTKGPIPQAGNVIPQVFLNFRASTLFLRTTPSSNATVNFTLTAEPTDISITTLVNTSVSLIVAVGVPETQTTTLGITFLEEDQPSVFDIESITLSVSNASATSSFLPSASLPLASLAPTFVPPPNVSWARNIEATIMGAVLGGILGVLLL